MIADIDRGPLDQLVKEWATTHHCPSISWGIVNHGTLVLTGGTGTVDGHVPDPDTAYRIASMTKSFSAAATLLLRDEGRLALDAPIDEFAPELAGVRGPTDDAAPITVRDLLAMTSGLVSDDAWADRHLDLTDDEFDRMVARGLVHAQPTGSAYEYSNFGYALLGRVVHRATGTRIQQHISERLLGPLGMRATTWERRADVRSARPMRWLDDHHVEEAPTPGDGLIAPMGGLWTTVADLARWVGWLADAFPARDGTDNGPLRRASRREMQTAQRYVGLRTVRGVRAPTTYGYGVRQSYEPGHGTVITHSGGLPGYGSNMRWTPGGAIGIVTMANVTYAPMTPLGARLHDLLADQGVAPAETRPVPPALAHLAERVLEVHRRWATGTDVSRSELDGLFADNVHPDEAFERRASTARTVGVLEHTELVAVTDATAKILGTTSSGRSATITFTLAPIEPLRVQDLRVTVAD